MRAKEEAASRFSFPARGACLVLNQIRNSSYRKWGGDFERCSKKLELLDFETALPRPTKEYELSVFVKGVFFDSGDLSSYRPSQIVFIRTVNSILNLALGVVTLSGVFHIVVGEPENVIHNWGITLIFLIPKIFLKRGNFWFACALFILIVNLILYFYSGILGPQQGFQNFFLVTTVIPFIMGLDRKPLAFLLFRSSIHSFST